MKEIGIHLRTLEGILAIHSHEESGAVMRNLIEWWGEVELPSQWRYESWISTAQSTLAEVEGLVFEDDPRATACTLLALQRRGIDIAEAEEQLFHDHEAYFYGFMSGGAGSGRKARFRPQRLAGPRRRHCRSAGRSGGVRCAHPLWRLQCRHCDRPVDRRGRGRRRNRARHA